MNKRQTLRVLAGAIGAACLGIGNATASSWPDKPVRIIVPFPAGGSTDFIARYLADGLSRKFHQPFIVDNRTGASGNIGTEFVAKAAPDGYTLGLVTSGPLANNRYLYKHMPFDAEKDLTPIGLVCDIPLVIATNPKVVPARDLREFVAAAKATPAGVSVGTPGNGTVGHLVAAALAHGTKAPLQSIPYRGDSTALQDLLGGAVQAVSAPLSSYVATLSAGKIRGLAVTSRQRFPGLPEIPTAKEQGFDIEADVWIALVGPSGLSPALVQTLNAEINTLLADTQGRARLQQYGAVVTGGPASLVRPRMTAESSRWSAIVAAAQIVPE